MKTITIIILIVAIIVGIIIFLGDSNNGNALQKENIQNVSIVDDKQIVEIRAKGGYIPRKSIARAGILTILRFDTNGTFDCSASVRIPSMNVFEILPNSGSKDIDLGIPKVGTLQGSCGMGMYSFEINFQN